MISKTEQVWRHLVVEALGPGPRRYASLSHLARELGFGVSTVHRALRRPVETGAVQVLGRGGVRVVDPLKLLVLWAGNRNVRADLLAEMSVAGEAAEVERHLPADRFVLGGFGAVVAGDRGNLISGYDRVLCYGDPKDLPSSPAVGERGDTRVMILEGDPLLRRYGEVTPLPQAYVDLFNLPGWPAARFVSTLNARWFAADAS